MFENLSEKLQRAFKTLRGQAVLNEENMQEALRAIRLALLEADVNFKVVKQLIDHIQEKAVGQQVATALSPAEQVIKILRDELIEILGRDTAKVKFASCKDRARRPRRASWRIGSRTAATGRCWSPSTSTALPLASSSKSSPRRSRPIFTKVKLARPIPPRSSVWRKKRAAKPSTPARTC